MLPWPHNFKYDILIQKYPKYTKPNELYGQFIQGFSLPIGAFFISKAKVYDGLYIHMLGWAYQQTRCNRAPLTSNDQAQNASISMKIGRRAHMPKYEVCDKRS